MFDEYVGKNWGDGTAMRFLIGTNAPREPAVDELFARFERNAATPTAAQAVLRRGFDIDCRPIRHAIRVPTLVLAHRDDPVTQLESARETAAEIPGARFVETESPGHWSWDIADRIDLDVIEEFLTGRLSERRADRVLATVLYTDIVGSTQLAFELGDARWRTLLDRHDDITRRELRRFRGREVNTTGDGFVAAFDGPARGVECAQAIVREARELGINLRAGLHTGECELRGVDLAGATMHVGARIAALAGPGEVLVSRTVRDLVTGSGIEFDARGEHDLKGIPRPTEVYAVVAPDG